MRGCGRRVTTVEKSAAFTRNSSVGRYSSPPVPIDWTANRIAALPAGRGRVADGGWMVIARAFVARACQFAVAGLLALWALGVPAPALAQGSDLVMSKTAPASAAADTDITYTLTVINLGTDDTSPGNTTVSDPLPAGVTFVSVTPPGGWTCSNPAVGLNGTVSCSNTATALVAGTSATITIVGHIAPATPPGSVLNNTATVNDPTDPTTENNSATAGTVVSGGTSADLVVTKAAPTTIQPGQNITYTFTAGNNGPDDAASASLTDTLPGTETFVSLSAPAGWSCTTPSVGSGGTVNCSIATFVSGASANFTLVANIPAGTAAGTIYDNTVSISTATSDPTPENDSATATTEVVAANPDLAIAKSHSGNAQQGQAGFTYTITVSNVGAVASAGAVTVTDTVPSGMTATAISGTGWSCTLATATCTRADALAAAATYPPITLTVNVSATAPSSVFNTASVSGGGDTNPDNNTASDPTTVIVNGVDLAIAKSHGGSAQRGQSGFVYTITVSSVGTAASAGTVTVTDTVPTGMTATAMSGTGWTCTVATATCTRADALGAGATYPPITLAVNVASNAPSSVTNTATVSGGGDVNAANNSASDPTTVAGGPTARNFAFTILAGTSKSVDLTSGATGGPFTGATIVSITPAGAGTATIVQSGGSFILTFTPASLFTGTAVITYTLSSSSGTSAPATVTITVVARPDPSRDPEVIGLINAQIGSAERFANAQMMNVNQRLETLHEDGYGDDHQGIGIASNDSRTPNAQVAEAFGDLPGGASSYADASRPGSPSKSVFDGVLGKSEPMPRKAPPLGPAQPRRDLAFWSSGYVNFGSANDVVPGSGFGFTTSGVTVGADYRFSPQLTAGLGLGYGNDRTRIGNNGTESKAQTFNVTAYETYRPWRGFFLDGLLGAGSLRFDSQRFVTGNADFAFGSRNGHEWFGSLSAGYDYRAGHVLLSPYGRVKAIWLSLDAFTEAGDPTGSLTFGAQSVSTYTGVLGLRGKYDIPTQYALVSPRFRVEYNHAFQNGGLAALAYADWIGGPTFFVPATATTSDFATLGLGVDAKFLSGMFVSFDYQTMINAFDTRSHMFQLKAGKRF